ncbi:MAG: 2-amino-4-hydroxy-6-hydroxymethyldihydropteridine diphosphokinase [Woeseiaceae bacterium]|nr:2-amino-4-hydroxy-6-hydroxymethyldihydropteridine diphosphokinase [Woeseiaceae bacterium]
MAVDCWRPAYVGIGSNLDGPAQQVEAAIGQLAELPRSRLIAYSGLYRSSPLGGIEQPDFVNAVAALLTRLTAPELLAGLQSIEAERGRQRGEQRWGPRIIDLDLLVFGRDVIDDDALTVPHPGIAERNFVLLPLRELAPDLTIPGLGRVAGISVNYNEPRIERIA